MLPTLSVYGDRVLLSRYYRRGRDVSVGDIVSFSAVVDSGGDVMKRVLGMPGDYVLRYTPGRGDVMIQVCYILFCGRNGGREGKREGDGGRG